MKFNIITLFPNMFKAIKEEGVISRAIKNNIINIDTYQLRNFSNNKYKNIDDKPYGGGRGMVMQVKPIRDCINKIKNNNKNTKIIYLSPQGKRLSHSLILELAKEKNITLLCGRYQGVDERVIENDIDMEISLGDFVVTGGELPAMLLIDAISRQINGVLGNEDSLNDSFATGMLDYPHYTRPQEIDGQKVPIVLLNGHDEEIKKWRKLKALTKTKNKRPDLIVKI